MYGEIEKIINAWDPAELFPLAPQDEYNKEIAEILDYLEQNHKNLSSEKFGEAIKRIFIDSLGEDMFFRNNERDVAYDILLKIKES